MKRLVTLGLAAGMSVLVTHGASAATINVGSFSGGTAVLHAPGTLADGLNVVLGSVLITGDLGTFESYCVDLQHYDLSGPNQTVVNTMDNWNNTAVPAQPGSGGAAASWLYNTYAAGAVGNKTNEAALSLAIWNALYDIDFSVGSQAGTFWVSNVSNATYVSLADQYLAALHTAIDGGGPLGNDYWLQTTNVSGHYAQDFIAPVPEPGTLLLLASGLACGALRRRRAQNS